jgi:endonuclease/exonuclease/phosphatase (EEP) superfamily protein YafD
MTTVLHVVGAIVILATLIPLVKREAWWIRIFDFPRIQIVIVGAIVLAGHFALASSATIVSRLFELVLLLCLLHQAYMIYPYTPFVPKKVKPASTARTTRLSLLLSNVLISNRNAPGLIKIIRARDPDVILILEADDWWEAALAELEQSHRFIVKKPLTNAYGMILYSRLELASPELLFRIYDDIPSIRARLLAPGGLQIALHCLHPKPPVPQEEGSSKQRDAELLIVGKETRGSELPVIVMGDLNDVAWSHTNYLFQRISGLLDPRIGRGFYSTFDARYPIMRFPLDHFFHSAHFRLIELRRLPYFGSDHFPMYIALSYEPDAPRDQQPETPSTEDREEANEKIERARDDG